MSFLMVGWYFKKTKEGKKIASEVWYIYYKAYHQREAPTTAVKVVIGRRGEVGLKLAQTTAIASRAVTQRRKKCSIYIFYKIWHISFAEESLTSSLKSVSVWKSANRKEKCRGACILILRCFINSSITLGSASWSNMSMVNIANLLLSTVHDTGCHL